MNSLHREFLSEDGLGLRDDSLDVDHVHEVVTFLDSRVLADLVDGVELHDACLHSGQPVTFPL